MISQGNKSGFRNPWLLGMLALVAIVLVVNGVLIWLATHNQSALVDRDYKTRDRKTGTAFLGELGVQQTLGWRATINRPVRIVRGEPTLYEIDVVDRDGKPVSAEVSVEAYRASDAARDFTIRFREVSIGTYQESIVFPLKGYWELHIRITRGDEVFAVRTDRFQVAEAH